MKEVGRQYPSFLAYGTYAGKLFEFLALWVGTGTLDGVGHHGTWGYRGLSGAFGKFGCFSEKHQGNLWGYVARDVL